MPGLEDGRVIISQGDYSLRKSGARDAARHDQKVKEAIRGNLDTILSDGAIITADPKSKRIIKIPQRSLVLPHIVFGDNTGGVGSGNGESNQGDLIGADPGQGQGAEVYETELDLEVLQRMAFEELGLPFLQPKEAKQIETDTPVFDDIRPKRTPNNLDIFRTIEENMRRNAQEHGRVEVAGIIPEDYRVRTWREDVREENAAAVIFKRDFSGSMGPVETYLTRIFGWWTVAFLRSKYPRVETAFIIHDTNAQEVSEEAYFKRIGGGGTKCSSAYEMTLDLMRTRYTPDRYNVYSLHFSDGDNWNGGDNTRCVKLVQEILGMGASQAGFIQVGSSKESDLRVALTNEVKHPRFVPVVVEDKQRVWPGLQKFFDINKTATA